MEARVQQDHKVRSIPVEGRERFDAFWRKSLRWLRLAKSDATDCALTQSVARV